MGGGGVDKKVCFVGCVDDRRELTEIDEVKWKLDFDKGWLHTNTNTNTNTIDINIVISSRIISHVYIYNMLVVVVVVVVAFA